MARAERPQRLAPRHLALRHLSEQLAMQKQPSLLKQLAPRLSRQQLAPRLQRLRRMRTFRQMSPLSRVGL